ncbi:MAG: hypothetical protein JO249_00265 [Acidobacteria bacterium]|nr:hypothetical protein [Acidobacteriota bacterium]
MKFALVNPAWEFREATFICPQPHYPLPLLFAFERLRAAGQEAMVLDAQLGKLSLAQAKRRLDRFKPDYLVVATSPYLFRPCPPPQFGLLRNWLAELDQMAIKVAIGPLASLTPALTMRRLDCHVAIRGEPEEVLAELPLRPWSEIEGCCWMDKDGAHISPSLARSNMRNLGALSFDNYDLELRRHCHGLVSTGGHGGELELARKAQGNSNETVLRGFRERDVRQVLKEIDALVARGVDYIYWTDEIFPVSRNVEHLLDEIAKRPIRIGLRTRIDLWTEETVDLLGRAHCVSLECDSENDSQPIPGGRLSNPRICELLIYARKQIPSVQVNLILGERDEQMHPSSWQELKRGGVRVSESAPRFPYPGTSRYEQIFGPPDEYAWERAYHYYFDLFHDQGSSDFQPHTPPTIEGRECTF